MSEWEHYAYSSSKAVKIKRRRKSFFLISFCCEFRFPKNRKKNKITETQKTEKKQNHRDPKKKKKPKTSQKKKK